jgi:hypothetical protein
LCAQLQGAQYGRGRLDLAVRRESKGESLDRASRQWGLGHWNHGAKDVLCWFRVAVRVWWFRCWLRGLVADGQPREHSWIAGRDGSQLVELAIDRRPIASRSRLFEPREPACDASLAHAVFEADPPGAAPQVRADPRLRGLRLTNAPDGRLAGARHVRQPREQLLRGQIRRVERKRLVNSAARCLAIASVYSLVGASKSSE